MVIGLAVRKGNQPLLDELSGALGKLREDGSYGALLERYNLADPSAEEIRAALGN